MCNACSVLILVCAFCIKLDSAWKSKGLSTIIEIDTKTEFPGIRPPVPLWPMPPPGQEYNYEVRTGMPPPVPLWPMPPPGQEYNYEVRPASTTTTRHPSAWQQKGLRTRSTPAPTTIPTTTRYPGFLQPAPKWPLPPPPDKDSEGLQGPNRRNFMSNDKNFIPLVTFDTLPFWERQDPAPARRSFPKHKRLRKKTLEKSPSTQFIQNDDAPNNEEIKEANTKWPKVRSSNDRRRDYMRSTRLAPYQLAQYDPTPPAKGKQTLSVPIMDGTLNTYSMKEDLEILLRDIDEANVTVEVITRTVEYNDIVICKITQAKQQSRYFRAEEDKYMDEEPEKKIIFIVHGLSAMGFTKVPCLNEKKSFMKLLKYYTAHLDKFDIFIIPMANPDGIGDETLDYWNKNKSPQAACLGVALDRNFDVAWNASSINSCNQLFPGPSPFSELESRAIGDVLHHYSHKIIAYIHVHAGTYASNMFKGDAVLYPKGFTEVATEDDKYIDIKGEIDEAIRNAGFKVMSVSMETLFNWYGKVHGSSVDFAATIYGVPYALEFVMQPYDDDLLAENSYEMVSDNVLTEIWRRVIDVVFTNIYKNTRANDVN